MGEINKLSDKKLKTYLGQQRDKELTVADGKGLSIRVSRSGHISWVFAYRLGGRGSPLERVSLGSYPDVSLKSARDKRDDCRTWLTDGHNSKVKLKESKCSGQQKLATTLEFFQYRFSDSLGGNPPLYSCGLSAL